jgi:hypothetical protein
MEGEVLAAARSAARYLKSRGASWDEVIHEPSPPVFRGPQEPAFIGLQDAVILKRTQRARLITVKLTQGRATDLWFPCSTLRERDGKIYVARWIIKQKEKELLKGGIPQRIQVDVH